MTRPVSPETIALVGRLRALAAEGIFARQAAELTGVTRTYAFILAKKYGFTFKHGTSGAPRDEVLRAAITAGYEARVSPRVIAQQTGASVGTVRVLACRMGIRSGSRRDPGRFRRGYEIPDDLREQYRQLRALGLTMEECGYELGLLQRSRIAA